MAGCDPLDAGAGQRQRRGRRRLRGPRPALVAALALLALIDWEARAQTPDDVLNTVPEVPTSADDERALAQVGLLGDGDPENDAAAVAELSRWIERFRPPSIDGPSDDPREDYRIRFWLWLSAGLASQPGGSVSDTLLTHAHALAAALGDPVLADQTTYQLVHSRRRTGNFDGLAELLASRLEADPSPTWLPPLLLADAQLARMRGNPERASSQLDRIFEPGVLLDTAADGVQPEPWLAHRQTRGLALAERSRVEQVLGRLDRAAAAAFAALDLAELPAAPGAAAATDPLIALDARLAIASLRQLQLDFEAVLTEVDRLVEDGLVADDDARVLFLRGRAEGELEKADRARPPRAAASLEAALETPGLDGQWTLEAMWMLSDLALDRGAFDVAAAWLERARNLRRQLGMGGARTRYLELPLLANEAELACSTAAPEAVLRRIEGDLHAALEGVLETWDQATDGRGSIGLLEEDRFRSILGELARVATRLDGRAGSERALDAWLAVQGGGSLARERQLAPCAVDDVRTDLLDDGGGALVYLATSPTTHLLAIDGESVEYFALAGGYDLQATGEQLVRDLRTRPAHDANAAAVEQRVEALRSASAQIGAALMPAELWPRVQSWPSVTVVGAHFFWGLPIESIETPDGRLLGEAVPLTQVASLPIAVDDRRRHRDGWSAEAPSADFALLATLTPAPAVRERFGGLVSVPLDADDLELQLEPWPADRRTLLLEPPPTPDDFLRSFETAAVVQVLAHGVLDPMRERGAGIALSGPGESGLLWPEALDALQLEARGIVVLTSCGTAVGPERRGDDQFAHLAGALLARGASGVVTTRARLELGLAERLAAELSTRLNAGDSLAEALRRARVSLGADDRELAFELARIQLLGSPHSTVPARAAEPANRWGLREGALVAGALALIASAAAALARWRRASTERAAAH